MNRPMSKSEFLALVDEAIEQLMTGKKVSAILVADALSISVQRLQRYIKSSTGMSSLEYIDNYRLERAKTLLLSNNMQTIAGVGYQCGFEEPTHFNRFFKRVTGMTPREFRQQHNVK